jgi:hypothetical protein
MTRWKVNAISLVVMITVLTGCGISTAAGCYYQD